jgi:hypothetical protein
MQLALSVQLLQPPAFNPCRANQVKTCFQNLLSNSNSYRYTKVHGGNSFGDRYTTESAAGGCKVAQGQGCERAQKQEHNHEQEDTTMDE